MLHRLVGRTIFADGDGVVGPHIQVRNLHEGGQTHSGTLVVGEHEEGATERTGMGAQQDAVGDGTHGELAHAEVQLTAVRAADRPLLGGALGRSEGGSALKIGLVGATEVGGAPQSSGMTAAMAFSTEPEAPRVATPLPTSKVASRSSMALSKPSGSSPALRRSYRAALSGLALRHALYFSSHSLWASRPRSATLRA